MSIATAIAAAQQKVANAYTAVSNKGGTLPATRNLSNLPTAINSISGGGVDTTGWIPRTISNNTLYAGSSTKINLTGVTSIWSYALAYAYYYSSNISGSIDLGNITSIYNRGCYCMFEGASSVTSVNLNSLNLVDMYACYSMFSNTGLTSFSVPSLQTISNSEALGRVCYNCTNLTSASLANLETVSGGYGLEYAFYSCSSLTSVTMSKLATVSGNYGLQYMFAYTPITSFTFSKLSTLNSNYAMRYCFRNCTSLTSLSFPKLTSSSFGSYTNQFSNMLLGVTGCTVYFPSNLQSVIGSWSDVTTGFGGTNTTVRFTLSATS